MGANPGRGATARLDPAFDPGAIAIVGASTNPRSPGYRYVKSNADRGFEPIFPINPNADEVYGLLAYDSILDVPEPVDLAIVLLRADRVPAVLRECAEAGVSAVHVGSSGFAETNTEAGERLEAEVAEIAREHGITLIGPNCMGLYNARANLTYLDNAPTEPGIVSYVSHSGGFTLDLLTYGSGRGLPLSKGASIGNSVDVSVPECLEYYLSDDETEIIGVYVEGVATRDRGDRLVDVLRRAEKPIVALKGGRTDRGGEAARSHTGALAGSYRVWRTLFAQTHVIEVRSLAEMVDTFALLAHARTVAGNATAVIGPGGGTTVVTVDACADAGIAVPPFADDTVAALEAIDVPAAGNLRNPVDVPFSALFLDGGSTVEALLETAAADPAIDSAIVHLNATHFTYGTVAAEPTFREMVDQIAGVAGSIDIPLLLVFRNVEAVPELQATAADLRRTCMARGVPVFGSMASAVTALRNVVDYSQGGST